MLRVLLPLRTSVKMKVVKPFLLFLLLLTCIFANSADVPIRQQFMNLYYRGEYEKAHAQLTSAISDPGLRKIWESRIHLQGNISGCSFSPTTNHSVSGFAHLVIGHFNDAIPAFSDDWISLWGKAIYANWNADQAMARKNIEQALTLQPQNPELVFFAGDVAKSTEKTIEYFTHFLKMNPEDDVKRNIARFSIELLKKTAGMELNIIHVEKGVQEIETDYVASGLVVNGTVNSSEKLKLLVDTGAGSGLIFEHRKWTPQIVNDVVMLGLGKKQINTSKRVVLDLFQTGNYSIRNPLATENERMPFSDIDGLIGSALFGTHRILLPVKNSSHNLVLLPYELNPLDYLVSQKSKLKHQATLPFYLVNKLIVIKGSIKKSPVDLDILVDTGADASLVSIAAAKRYAHINHPLSMQMRRQSAVSGVGGKADNLMVAENVEVGIGNLSKNFNNMLAINFAESSEALGLEIDLLLGRDFLAGYTLLIDYRNRQLTFLK
jgi:hypothetical protein